MRRLALPDLPVLPVLLAVVLLVPACKKSTVEVYATLDVIFHYAKLADKAGVPEGQIFAMVFDALDIAFDCAEADPFVQHASPAKAKAGNAPLPDQIVTMTATTDDAVGFVQWQTDLVAPFRVEVEAGVYDQATAPSLGGGFYALELMVKDSAPVSFFTIAGLPVVQQGQVAQTLVFVATESGNHGQLLIGTPVVELAVEADGTDLTFQARGKGTSTWETIDVLARPAPDTLFLPGLGVSQFDTGGQAGFNGFAVLSNGSSPYAPGSLQDILFDVNTAMLGALRAGQLVEGNLPDTATAQSVATEAQALAAAAAAALQPLIDQGALGKAGKAARKDALAGSGKLAKALGGLAAGKAAKGIHKKLNAAFRELVQAGAGVRLELELQKP